MNMTENRTWEREMPIGFHEAMKNIRNDQAPLIYSPAPFKTRPL